MANSVLLYFVTIEFAFTILVALLCVCVFVVIGIYMSASAVESGQELRNDNQHGIATGRTS